MEVFSFARVCWGVALIVGSASNLSAQLNLHYDPEEQVWTIQNRWVQALFQLTGEGTFELRSFSHVRTQETWVPPNGVRSSPIKLRVDNTLIDANTHFRLVRQSARSINRRAYRQTIVLEDERNIGRVTLQLEMFLNQPVLRYRVLFQNLQSRPVLIRAADMLPWALRADRKNYRTFQVNQWVAGGQDGNFEPIEGTLIPDGAATQVESGAHGQHCGWLTLRDDEDRGILAGWEFDGRASASVRQTNRDDALQFSASIMNLNRPVGPDEQFEVPAAFIGLFHGDWDEAGYRTQRFAEAAATEPLPDRAFPYVMWDSWGYLTDIDELTLRRNAAIAAQLGIEVFVIDLGWARQIGDWRDDPKKFPSGMRVLSDYVHSLGMKFGLHFPLAEADSKSPVLRSNPNWTSSETYGYFDAQSLCLSHTPVKEWIIEQAVRMIDDYNVDWIVQDGENMVKKCTKTTHTHNPQDSNYSNAVDGLNAVVAEVQRQRPNTHWENCEDGGNMMTFNMVRNYVTSIAADNSGAMTTRQAIYGVTYPFPPRYSDRYMPDDDMYTYITRSFMFGGPWIFMNHLASMSKENLQLAASEIALYKQFRTRVRDGKVFHLTARPAENRIDAMESYHEATDTALVFVFRPYATARSRVLRLRGLKPETTYQIHFQEDTRLLSMTGRQLMEGGLRVFLPDIWWAEIVYLEPVQPTEEAGTVTAVQ